MIEQRNLFRLQSKLTVKAKSIPVKTLEKDYILTWILVALADQDMENIFVFKGGTALKKFYIKNYRFSEDLDFTLLNPITINGLKQKLDSAFKKILDLANISLAINRSESHSNSYTIIVNFAGPLGASMSRGEIKIDFTINELLLFPITRKMFFHLYEEYNDIPRDVEVLVYSIEEVIIEKLVSLIDPSRNEPRDLYDVWYLLDNDLVQLDLVKDSFLKKAEFKNIKLRELAKSLDKKEGIYKRLWDIRLNHQILNLPYFEEIFRDLKRRLRNF
jgi:predicted nucleotidyltransferase component of viral defense system